MDIYTKEQEMLENIIRYIPGMDNLSKAEETYSSYDAYNKEYIVELKARNKSYEDTIIEVDKMKRNLKIAQESNRKFIYIVEDPSGLYAFSISKLIDQKYNFKYGQLRCPETSHFNRNKMVMKDVAYVSFKDAQWCSKEL